jgi:hypothetical protein
MNNTVACMKRQMEQVIYLHIDKSQQ